MPQLDTLTYLSQFTWLTVFFLLLYFRLTGYYLPRIAQILKLRRKSLIHKNIKVTKILEEKESLNLELDGLYKSLFKIVNQDLNEKLQVLKSKDDTSTFQQQLKNNFEFKYTLDTKEYFQHIQDLYTLDYLVYHYKYLGFSDPSEDSESLLAKYSPCEIKSFYSYKQVDNSPA